MRKHLITRWRKSTRSFENGNCVEVRLADGVPQVRDSKLGDTSPIFGLGQSDFAALLSTLDKEALGCKQ
jgi:hypothetical protein